MKIDYSFHTHTYRCGHAKGTDEDYIQMAIKAGLKRLGFSDHAMIPGIIQTGSRANYEVLDEYIDSINKLKEKYKDKIEIYVGFEAEFANRFKDYYQKLLDDGKLDFMILGQHFDFDESDNPKYIVRLDPSKNVIENYVKHILDGMDSGLFTYVAHPDLYVVDSEVFNEDCVKAAHEICKKAEQLHIPLEINCHASRYWGKSHRLCYPEYHFWEIASQYNVDVVIGYDAHNPEELIEDIQKEYKMVEKYHLHLIENFTIKR